MTRADERDEPRRPGPLATAVLGAIALAMFAGFVALGGWQLHRRAWKLDLIAQVDARVHAPPVPAPSPADWPRVSAHRDAYRHVALVGHFLHDRESYALAATELGSGYWVLTPLVDASGFTVLINRGWVSPDRRLPAARPRGQVQGEIRVTGLLRVSEPGGGFLRRNDPAHDRWFSRDVAGIARARRLAGAVAPYFVDADASPNSGGLPVGGLTVISFPNTHLVYALTWFALAAMTAGIAGWGLREQMRRR